ncbi:unnamed protein product [Caenorhabditis brenneri]
MSTKFPIFRLPPASLKHVVLQMNPIEILDFYQCTDKTTKKNLTSICANKIDISVNFDVYGRRDALFKKFDKNRKYLVTLTGNGYTNYIYVMEKKLIEKKQDLVDRTFGSREIPCIFKKEEKKEEETDEVAQFDVNNTGNESDEEDRHERKRNMNKKVIITYWDDIFEGTMDLTDFFIQVFGSPISELILSRTMSIWSFRRVIQWLLASQTSIKKIVYMNDALSEEDIMMFFSNCNVLQSLTINMTVTEVIKSHRYFDLDVLRIGSASWVTLDYILDMDCVIMNLSGVYLTSQQFNMFVKHWLNGSNYRLQLFTAYSREKIEKEEILDGITYNERSRHLVTRFKKYRVRNSDYIYMILGGYDIRRSDGKLATISVRMPGFFGLTIWNDDEISGGWHSHRFSEDDTFRLIPIM